MYTQPGFETCFHFVNSEAQHVPGRTFFENPPPRFAITISRQTGSGAHCVAEALACYLQDRTPQDSPAWTIFDKNLVEEVIEEHKLSPRIARFMPEDRVPGLTDTLDELLGVHPPAWSLVERTAATIRRLAERGNVILIGRGAHVITSALNHVFHVRLVATLEKRVQHISQLRGLTHREASVLVHHEDRGRQRYLKKYFGKDVDDHLAYHLTVNTDVMPYQEAALLIANAALGRFRSSGRDTNPQQSSS